MIRGKISVFDTSRSFDVSLAIISLYYTPYHKSEKLHQAGLRIDQDDRIQISCTILKSNRNILNITVETKD